MQRLLEQHKTILYFTAFEANDFINFLLFASKMDEIIRKVEDKDYHICFVIGGENAVIKAAAFNKLLLKLYSIDILSHRLIHWIDIIPLCHGHEDGDSLVLTRDGYGLLNEEEISQVICENSDQTVTSINKQSKNNIDKLLSLSNTLIISLQPELSRQYLCDISLFKENKHSFIGVSIAPQIEPFLQEKYVYNMAEIIDESEIKKIQDAIISAPRTSLLYSLKEFLSDKKIELDIQNQLMVELCSAFPQSENTVMFILRLFNRLNQLSDTFSFPAIFAQFAQNDKDIAFESYILCTEKIKADNALIRITQNNENHATIDILAAGKTYQFEITNINALISRFQIFLLEHPEHNLAKKQNDEIEHKRNNILHQWKSWGGTYLRLFDIFQGIRNNIKLYSYRELKKLKSETSKLPGVIKELIIEEINSRRTALPEVKSSSFRSQF